MLVVLLIPLGIATLFYVIALLRAAIAERASPTPEALLLGAATNFFDTLGIGSFAPTMAWFKFRRLVPDRLIPCTMFVGQTLPSVTQGIVFLLLLGVLVDATLLVGCVLACVVGGFVGVPLVTKARAWVVQAVVGLGLILAAILYALTNLHLMPGGGTASALPAPLLATAIVASFVFGVLLNFGIGNYAPTLALLSLMGMDPRLCFPIMAASSGLTMASASVRYIAIGELNLRIVTGMALGGLPAVFAAAFIVKSMPIEWLRWLVIVVVLYAAAVMLRAAFTGRSGTPQA
ncbi:MAG TPA: sulfite exporter TauE/SafE family protein [Sphingomicrobium sp.]|nr:sulfite exporter TauE/SafE family protein [Sphingomicrobium sp.]